MGGSWCCRRMGCASGECIHGPSGSDFVAQWVGQFSGLTHATRVKALEGSLRKTTQSLMTAAGEERRKQERTVRKLAARVLAARLRALRATQVAHVQLAQDKVDLRV